MSTPVAFLGFRDFRIIFICPILGNRGATSGRPSELIKGNKGVKPFHGPVKTSWSFSAIVNKFSVDIIIVWILARFTCSTKTADGFKPFCRVSFAC